VKRVQGSSAEGDKGTADWLAGGKGGEMDGEVAVAQRLTALGTANGVRTERAQLKRQFKARTTDPVQIVMELPRCCENVRISEFLSWVPRIGGTRARALMHDAKVFGDVELRRLGSHTRLRLAEELRATLARHS
jgi:hypothetical protein